MNADELFDVTELEPKCPQNRLYYGDNLTIMRKMSSASVDLIYLDPPFNSQRSYNLIYKQMTGLPVPEQEEAFCDAWELDPEKEEMARNMPIFLKEQDVDHNLILFWKAWIEALRNTQPKLLAYLVYMSYRLFEMKRILRSTGSIYLHCDPTASHYIKVILDGIFGHHNFANEIVWCYTAPSQSKKRFPRKHDVILFYTKTKKRTFNWEEIAIPYSSETVARTGRGAGTHGLYGDSGIEEEKHKNRLKKAGKVPEDWWIDIFRLQGNARERLGYPTQKPIALLNRIIVASVAFLK